MKSAGNTVYTAATILLLTSKVASPQQIGPSAGGEPFEKIQYDFAAAYNRKDIPAMTAFLAKMLSA